MSRRVLDVEAGQKLGRYVLLELIGVGGMGSVWRSEHPALGIAIAVKILSQDLVHQDPEFVNRFLREASLAASVNHPHLIRIYEAGCDGGIYFIAMEYIKGMDALHRLREIHLFTPEETLRLAIACTEALEAAHALGIIHRDIKPENILLAEHGACKIADMGIAKKLEDDSSGTMTGTALGTPYYIAPEQARDAKSADARSDIYSLGASLYHLITGRLPFEAPTPMALLLKHMNNPLVHPRVHRHDAPDNLCAVIMKMMEKNPARRYQSASELLSDLKKIHDHNAPVSDLSASSCFDSLALPAELRSQRPAQALPPSEPQSAPASRSALPWPLLAALLILALLLAVLIAILPLDGKREPLPLPAPIQTLPASEEKKPNQATTSPHANQIPATEILRAKAIAPISKALVQHNPGLKPLESWRLSLQNLNGLDLDLSDLPALVDISPLAAFPQLRALNIDGTGVSSFAALPRLNKLRHLSARLEKTPDCLPLASCANLATLRLGHLSTAPDLKGLTSLSRLFLGSISDGELLPLQSLRLETLVIADASGISDLRPLQQMPLTRLELPFHWISSIAPLQGLKLETLDLYSTITTVSDIQTIKDMPLRELVLPRSSSHNATLAATRSLRRLQRLVIADDMPFLQTVDKLLPGVEKGTVYLPLSEAFKE